MVKIASFNVNSINARLPNLLSWLKSSNPDIVLLQEIKCIEEKFPFDELLDAGYNSVVYGQKSYNGVAILSKFRIEDVIKGLPNYKDEQSRYIEALIITGDQVIRVASIYVPNGGGELGSDEKLEDSAKFCYDLKNFANKFTCIILSQSSSFTSIISLIIFMPALLIHTSIFENF